MDMNIFDFASEMVFGKKHLDKPKFDKEKYNLVKEVEKLFDKELEHLHIQSEKKYDLFTELGKDSHTHYHQ